MTIVDRPSGETAAPGAGTAWQDLRSLLVLERTGSDAFRAPATLTGHGTLFGGLVAALGVLAAGHCVAPGQLVHSLHAYFLRKGNDLPFLDIGVGRVRDGRAFAVREVEVRQGERLIFTMRASFHIPETGDDWHEDVSAFGSPEADVETRPSQHLRDVATPFGVRHVAVPRADGFVPLHPMWLRHSGRLPDDPVLQAAALTFMSDLGVVMDARPPGSTLPRDFIGTSLDHAMWFHRQARADDWLLMRSDPISSSGGRALTRARFHDRAGRLVATVLQEGLHRRAG